MSGTAPTASDPQAGPSSSIPTAASGPSSASSSRAAAPAQTAAPGPSAGPSTSRISSAAQTPSGSPRRLSSNVPRRNPTASSALSYQPAPGYASLYGPYAPVPPTGGVLPSAEASSSRSTPSHIPQNPTLGSAIRTSGPSPFRVHNQSFSNAAATNAFAFYSSSAGAASPRPPASSMAGSPARNAGLSMHAALGGAPSRYSATSAHALGTQTPALQPGTKLADADFEITSRFDETHAVSFTWTITELALLRDEVENSAAPFDPAIEGLRGSEELPGRSVSAGAGKSEIWTTQPTFDDKRWKLELVRTTRQLSNTSNPEATVSPTVLSVYLTSSVFEHSSPDLEFDAAIMIGLRPAQPQRLLAQHGMGDWIWQNFGRWSFTRENEFYECHGLPSLSELLQIPAVARHDAIALTVQIVQGPGFTFAVPDKDHMPPGTLFPQPNTHHVPKSMLTSLESLLDCSKTGDVRLVVRERGWVPAHVLLAEDGQELATVPPAAVRSYPRGSYIDGDEDEAVVVVRDRIIWAHSAVLRSRSSYFATMLDSGFSEGQLSAPSADAPLQRRFSTLCIPDTDFATAYWLLRFLYVGEVDFAPHENVKEAVVDEHWGPSASAQVDDSVSAGTASGVLLRKWTRLSDLPSSDLGAVDESSFTSRPQPRLSSRASASSVSSSMSTPAGGHDGAPPSPARPAQEGSPVYAASRQTRFPSGAHPRSASGSLGRSFSTDRTQMPSVHQTRAPAVESGAWANLADANADEHAHPCGKAPPASSLSMYKLAHRYGQAELQRLAKRHLIAGLTPNNAFAVLLATSLYPDVHAGVKEFLYYHWQAVSSTPDFEQCCEEVSAGEWGVDAGRSLLSFMRSLVSPYGRSD